MTVVLVTWALLMTGCSVLSPSPDQVPSQADAERTLDRVEAAVRDRREDSFLAQFETTDQELGRTAELWWGNLTALDVSRFQLAAGPLGPAGLGDVAIDWAVPGDSGTASHHGRFSFRADAEGTVRIAAVEPAAAPAARPSWWSDQLRVVRQGRATVVAVGSDPFAAATWANRADRAADRVAELLRPDRLRQGWTGDVVVELPATSEGYHRLLGGDPGSHDGYAAVAWAEGVGDPRTERIAVRVVVNPTRADLDPRAVDLLLTHEVTHLARYDAGSRAPLWVVEGFADHLAYTAAPDLQAAAEQSLRDTVRSGGVPDELPGDDAFRRGELDRAYLLAWSACRLIAESHSEEGLQRFVVAAGAGQPVDQALRSATGVGLAEFRTQWAKSLAAVR